MPRGARIVASESLVDLEPRETVPPKIITHCGFNDGARKRFCEQDARRRTHNVQVQSEFIVTNLLFGVPTRRSPFQSAALGWLKVRFSLFIPAMHPRRARFEC